ncbi:hypothetical protein THIOKS13330036 [Thiocapsa sp. KS1]|nr:hypothetical protein THIOKS13330036 [Thiocapsa sp. KS1]
MPKVASLHHGAFGNDPGKPANETRSHLDKYVTAAEVDQAEWSRTWVVNQLLDAGRLYEIYGKWKTGKSLAGLDLGAHLSCGMPWCGRAVIPCVVIYVAGEAVDETLARLASWRMRKRVAGGMPFYVRKVPTGLGIVALAEEFAAEVREISDRHPDLHPVIIIDTLARNLGPGLKEDGEGMGAFGNNLQDLLVKPIGCTAFVIHHSGHAEGDRSRGASQWHAVIDGSMRIGKTPDGIVTMDAGFMRSGAGGDRFAWKIEVQQLPGADNFGAPIEHPVLYSLDPPATRAKAPSANERIVMEIVAALEAEGARNIASETIRARWRDRGYPHDKNCARTLSSCVDKGHLHRSGGGWISTPSLDTD